MVVFGLLELLVVEGRNFVRGHAKQKSRQTFGNGFGIAAFWNH